MLPKLPCADPQKPEYYQYLQALSATSFQGDICTDLASRLLMATDNSIYQIIPEAVLYPKSSSDIQCALSLAQQAGFKDIRFSPRGGGTGTNGQSLTPGIMIDCSRYMHHIIEVNTVENWVRVQPGVVLDQLKEELAEESLFFAPSLSPGNRATLGGMFNTDACGLGSCRHGRTSQHVLAVSCILSDGTAWHSLPITKTRLEQCKTIPGIVGDIHQTVDETVTTHKALIQQQFPQLPRHMTGYNLAKVYDDKGENFSLNYLLSGSEGTLAFITELKLSIIPKPKKQVLFAIKYASFDDALRAARDLLPTQPTAIETIDDKIWRSAKSDEIYYSIQPMLDPDKNDTQTQAINFVQFSTDETSDHESSIEALKKTLEGQLNTHTIVGYYEASDANEIKTLWNLRKKSVGILAACKEGANQRQQLPFVEDTAVPPENLADYIAEFRALLESFGLSYGMFGHVDAGCLHVRPALDMTLEAERNLVPVITQKVNALVKKYGGVLWAEHGRGFRTTYTEDYFGPTLFHALRQIKTAFDPQDKLNPGKIATSLENHVQPVEVVSPTRGERDQHIPLPVRQQFDNLMRCNGNGQCFDYQVDHVMCPSAKVTRNRIHSPKGRATVFREWLKRIAATEYALDSQNLVEPGRKAQDPTDFSSEVYDAMSGCLGCKACASSCPVNIDIPHIKAQFLAHYHTRYRRPLRDHFIKYSEQFSYHLSMKPAWLRLIFQNKLSDFVLAKFGLVDLPRVKSNALKNICSQPLSPSNAAKTVGIIPDVTSCYDPQVLIDTHQLLSQLGFEVYAIPFHSSGKPTHAKGFLGDFEKIAQYNQAQFQTFIEQDIPLIAIEPSIALCFRDEYAKILKHPPRVHLLQEWLAKQLPKPPKKAPKDYKTYRLFGHCSERALLLNSGDLWQSIFSAFGLKLEVITVGCCGMAGIYGHEIEHQAESKALFQASWQAKLNEADSLATGFSCRCQAKRLAHMELAHPVSVLARTCR